MISHSDAAVTRLCANEFLIIRAVYVDISIVRVAVMLLAACQPHNAREDHIRLSRISRFPDSRGLSPFKNGAFFRALAYLAFYAELTERRLITPLFTA